MANYSTFDLLNGYENDLDENRGKFIAKVFSGSVKHRRKTKKSKLVRNIHAIASGTKSGLAYASLRTYGAFLLGFGLLTLLLRFVINYLFGHDFSLESMIIGAVFALIGIPFLIFDKPISIAFQEFAPTDYLLFEFFCIKRTPKKVSVKGIPWPVGLVAGLLVAGIGFIVPVQYVVIGMGGILFLWFAMLSPEFSFFATLLSMPYFSFFGDYDVLLEILVTVTLLSFVIKVVLGKRVYYFEQYDALLFVFMFFVLLSGIFVKGFASFTSSISVVLLVVGYFLASSLLSNRRLAENMIKSIMISAVPLSVLTVIRACYEIIGNAGLNGYSGVGIAGFSSDELAGILLISTAFALYFINTASRTSERIIYNIVFFLIFAALIATYSVFALVAGAFGIIAYFANGMRRGAGIALALICALPYVLIFMPPSIFEGLDQLPVLSSLGLYESAQIWRYSLSMFVDNILIGVGVGKESFNTEIQEYLPGSFATDSGNFILEIGIEAGVFALLVLVLIFGVRFRHRARYRRIIKDSRVDKLSALTSAAVACLTVEGVVNYIWSNSVSNYLFWCLFGVGSAVLRLARREYDDMVGYFSDSRSFDMSSVDIQIR